LYWRARARAGDDDRAAGGLYNIRVGVRARKHSREFSRTPARETMMQAARRRRRSVPPEITARHYNTFATPQQLAPPNRHRRTGRHHNIENAEAQL